jgi:RHS repeat-associated protein
MTNYTFNLGTTPLSQAGTLTWNANGTLQQLKITDQINNVNGQTCTYGYDDLIRIGSANCGAGWSQTFGLDPFGNLKKTGSAQFLPVYTGESGGSPTNQYNQLSGGPSGTSNYYDLNGNLTSDYVSGTGHTYAWDADGNMTAVDTTVADCGSTGTCMSYDALDRMVEQRRSSGYQQIVYAPYGAKLALMKQQTFAGAFVKLPGGARAVYNSTGLAYYRHSDHLGSSRLATTPSRALYFDVAYAPYGEDYNNYGTTDLAFTDENQDTAGGTNQAWTTNLYDFLMREYRTGQGRWTSPDPSGLGAVNPANPQTWNRYAYVAGNPLLFTDPLGLQLMYCDTGDGNSFYLDSEDADAVEACGQSGGSFENVDVNDVVTVNGNTGDVEEVSWVNLDPVVPQGNSYADCVKHGGDYFSLANGLNYLTGGRTDHGVTGHLNQAFLGNTVSDVIGLFQGESSSVQNVALEKGLPKAASAGAALIPDIASTTTNISNLSVSTGTVSVSVTAMRTTTSVLPLGTMAQSATNLLTEGLETFATAVKLPIDLSTSYFSALVCGIGR